MNNNFINFLIRIVSFGYIAIVFQTVVQISMHEGFHWTLATRIATRVTYELYTVLAIIPIGGRVTYVPDPGEATWMVSLGGGVLTAFFLGFPLWAFGKWTLEKGDFWIQSIGFSIMATQILYAPVEFLIGIDINPVMWLTNEVHDVEALTYLVGFLPKELTLYDLASMLSGFIAMALWIGLSYKGFWNWAMTGQPPTKRELRLRRERKNTIHTTNL